MNGKSLQPARASLALIICMQGRNHPAALTAFCECKHSNTQAVTFEALAQLVIAAKERAQLLREVNVSVCMALRSWGIQEACKCLPSVIEELGSLSFQLCVSLGAA